MEFEYDSAKSMSNLVKHGISFNDAKKMWKDPRLQIIEAHHLNESRWIAIARIEEKYWSAVFTYRDERIRLISARRARQKEIALYES